VDWGVCGRWRDDEEVADAATGVFGWAIALFYLTGAQCLTGDSLSVVPDLYLPTSLLL